ncbi:MAG: PIG-L family deacetylase [Candidatus Omnitrophota bacterium]|nr:MAG: PIG-L family deacetylase [Candidatus Omnitrophota bacterium]
MPYFLLLVCTVLSIGFMNTQSAYAADDSLRIIVFGAHPDDCEIRTGGVAIMWEKLGHKVKYVSTTNGDIGHSVMAGGPLAIRRTQEAQEAAKVLGISETQVLDIHDGELMPTLENRKIIIQLIREWEADIVITNRPNDYHPDHRYTSILVMDAAYMVTVPFICPDVKPLKSNPVFLYWTDRFQKPYPSQADIVVGIDDVLEQKYLALHELASQFYEGGANGPGDPEKYVQGDKETLMAWLRPRFARRYRVQEDWRAKLEEFYGKEKAAQIQYAEAFEICEYGRQPSQDDIKKLFPFFPDSPK